MSIIFKHLKNFTKIKKIPTPNLKPNLKPMAKTKINPKINPKLNPRQKIQ